MWIVDGDHDEAIKRENTDLMASFILGAGELILPDVSHFAFLQDPVIFNQTLLRYSRQLPARLGLHLAQRLNDGAVTTPGALSFEVIVAHQIRRVR